MRGAVRHPVSRSPLVARGHIGQTADPSFIRRLNSLAVLDCVRKNGPVSRAQLSTDLNLSASAVTNIVARLKLVGLVQEVVIEDPAIRVGRKPVPIQFNASAGYVIGVDVGRTHLALSLTDLNGSLLQSERYGAMKSTVYFDDFRTSVGPAASMKRIAREIRSLAHDWQVPLDPDHVVGIGLGLPGPFDEDKQVLVKPPRMEGWDGAQVATLLQQNLGKDLRGLHILLDNDANMGAVGVVSGLGGWREQVGDYVEYLLYLKLGTGIGGGVILDGHLYRGSRGGAGEFGHMIVLPDGPRCDCGIQGCLEAVAGADAVVAEALKRGAHMVSSLDDVVEAAKQGDAACRVAITQAARYIGIALASLVNVLNPELIILGGGLAAADELLTGPLKEEVDARCMAVSSKYHLLSAPRGDRAVALGAAATVLASHLEEFVTSRLDHTPTAS